MSGWLGLTHGSGDEARRGDAERDLSRCCPAVPLPLLAHHLESMSSSCSAQHSRRHGELHSEVTNSTENGDASTVSEQRSSSRTRRPCIDWCVLFTLMSFLPIGF